MGSQYRVIHLLVLVLIQATVLAKNSKDSGLNKKLVRNLPDIDITNIGAFDIEQETNIFAGSAVANMTLNYGFTKGWDIGISLLNAQFASYSKQANPFQPDIFLGLERHWLSNDEQIIAGTQTGTSLLPQRTQFISFNYLEYQRHLSDWDSDFDIGIYYANAGLAGFDSVGLHLNLELPVWDKLRIAGDYLSGNKNLAASTVKLLWPINGDWRFGAGVQHPNVYSGDHWMGLLGIYWH